MPYVFLSSQTHGFQLALNLAGDLASNSSLGLVVFDPRRRGVVAPVRTRQDLIWRYDLNPGQWQQRHDGQVVNKQQLDAELAGHSLDAGSAPTRFLGPLANVNLRSQLHWLL